MIYMENCHVLWVIFNQLAILYMGKEWAYNEDIVGIQWYIPCIYVIIYICIYRHISDIRYQILHCWCLNTKGLQTYLRVCPEMDGYSKSHKGDQSRCQ